MSGKELRRPDDWCRLKGIRVLDPDGWRDENAPSWTEPISEAEFDKRLSICTQGPWDWATNQPAARPPADVTREPTGGQGLRKAIVEGMYRCHSLNYERLTDAVLALPELAALIADAERVRRVREVAEEWASHPWGDAVVFSPRGCAARLRRALDGEPQP